jgi:glyoxylase-like metal-dependent hydrolase (beta-lactamase superfamily II)
MSDPLDFKTTMEFAYGTPSPMTPGVVRVVANNPSPFTFRGTNTYLVGTGSLAVIDPGPDDEKHIEAVVAAANGRPITHIFITHAHRDHIDGAGRLKEITGAKTFAFGRSVPAIATLASSPSGKAFVNDMFVPDVNVKHGDRIAHDDWDIEALHTPGHAPDHLCFALSGRKILFSGDHVMAWNTTVIAPPEGHMASYMGSLGNLMERNDRLYLPGHGGRLEEPQRMVKAYLIHRRMREQEILELVRSGSTTIQQIVPIVYQGLESRLLPAATLSVLAHVEHLISRGLVACAGSASSSHALSPL